MTPVSEIAGALAYEMAVLAWYLDLPDTPLRTSVADQRQARRFYERQVPLAVIETALLLGSLRRLCRPAEAQRLPPIRSLAYFQPVVEELLETPVPDGYRIYLQRKMQPYLRAPAGAQSGTG